MQILIYVILISAFAAQFAMQILEAHVCIAEAHSMRGFPPSTNLLF